MKESIKTEVIVGDDTKTLEIERVEGDILVFYLNKEVIFSGDWINNFLDVFERAIQLWKNERAIQLWKNERE